MAFKAEKKSQIQKMKEEKQINHRNNKELLLEPEQAASEDPIEYSEIDMEESIDERKSMIFYERKHDTFNEGEEIKKAINSKVKGKRNVKKVMKKKGF